LLQTVPFNDDLEKAVIVASLSDPKILPKITDKISYTDFYKHSHQEIFRVIEELGSESLDSLAVQDKLSEPTKIYFQEIVKDSDRILPSLSNAIFYAETIRSKSKLRAGLDLGQKIMALCYQPNADADETLQDLEQMFAQFLRDRVLENNGESTHKAFQEFMDNLGKQDDVSGAQTGFRDIDLMLHRLEGLIILAARPGMGKTAFAINIARHVAKTKPVLFFSLEQTEKQIFERMLAAEAEIDLEEIRTDAFLDDRINQAILASARQSLSEVMTHTHIDENANIPASYITSVSRQKKFEWGEIGLIVVDYLHIMRLGEKNIVDALGDAVKELRALGKELNCPILLLSQLSRQPERTENSKKPNRRPELSDLRSSGEIEQSADVVMFLYRDSYYEQAGLAPDDDVVEVIIRKHRNGRTGIVPLHWLPKFIKFKDR
jgi:replicative DNA helicase